MGKKKKLGLTEYDMVNAVLSDTLFSDRIGKENFVDRTQLTSSYDEYLMDIPKMAQDNTFASGVFYDNDGTERSIKELDDSGFSLDFWNSGGVNGSGKLLSLSKDVMLADGTLLSEQRKREIMSAGIDEQTASEVAQMEAEAEAKRRSSLSENIAGALGVLGGSARAAAGSELVKDKLIPFFHPEKQQWVLKVANDEELKTHGAAINTYGASEVSDGIFNSFLKGIHNATAKTMSTLLNSVEAFTDFSEAFGNWSTGNGWESFDEGTTDKWAERYRKGSEEASLPTSLQSQDILSAEGLASGVGQGAVSLAQFAMLGGGASTLFRGLGSTLTWGNMGANLLTNMNRAGMFTAGMILNGGEAYDSAKQAGLDEEDAANMFLAVGAINSLVEMGLGANKLQKWLIGDKGAEQVPKIILEETGGDLSKLASKKTNILSRVTDKVNKFTEIPILGTAVEEASEEFIQTLVGKTGEFIYNNISDSDKTKYELPELQEVFKEAFGAAAVGAILGAVGGIGTLNAKKEEENKSILPHIVNGNTSIVRSSIRQLVEEGQLSPETAEGYMTRIDRLDELWNKNKDIFSKIAKLEGKDENAIKAHTLALIEREFDLKNEISEHNKKIAEIGSDSELSDAVKQQKINDVKNEILDVQKSLSNVTKQIESFIPDSDGNIKYFGLKDSYNNMKSFISKTANRILPLSEEEIEIWFNSTNASEDLNKLVNRVAEEGLTPEIKNEITTIMGLDDKSQFIANVESIRRGITEAKEKAKQELKEAKEKALKEEEDKRKNSREKTKDKKEKISKTSEKPEDKKEDKTEEEEDPFDFEEAKFESEGSNITDTPEEAEEVKITADDEVSEKDALLRRHAELQELKNATENPEEYAFFENEQYEIELRISEIDKEAKQAEKESESELDDDEKIVIKDIEKEEEQQEKIITSSDGYVTEASTNPQENIIRAEGVKRNTANTVTSLNINYTTTVENGKRKRVNKIKDGKLDINSNFDSRLQDPTQFKVGTTLRVIIPTYQQIKDRGIVGEYTENQYNNYLKSPDTLPIAFLDESGNIIGYLPTKMNVETNVNEEFLNTERIANAELREKIFNNQDSDITMTIIGKSKGVPMFRTNKVTLYRALGDGKSLAPDVHIAVYKDSKLQTSLNNTFPGKISSETKLEEGVVYAIVPTADGSNYYALPLTANRVTEASSNVIVKMIELFRANSKIASDKALIDERNSLLTVADFENHKEFMDAVQEIIYVNNDSDKYRFETSKKGITIGSETISWDDFKTTKGKDRVKELLSSRYAAIKLAKMGNPYSAYELKDGKLVTKDYSSYNDYLNDNKILTSNIQSEPIAGTNRRYFTAQSVIEVGNVKVEPKQLEQSKASDTSEQIADIERRRQEELKPYDERDRRSIEAVTPNNPNHKGFKVGQKHHDGNKYIVEKAFNEATSPESNYTVISKIRRPAEYGEDGKMIKAAIVDITTFDNKEQADKFLQEKLQKIQKLAGVKQSKINAKYDAELAQVRGSEQPTATTTDQTIDKSQNINTGRDNPYTDVYLAGNKVLNKETGDLILDFESNAEAVEYFINTYVNKKPLVKKGVEEVFDENPELANIGTQEQYSQYLDTIFPESKVKDIVYHGTDALKGKSGIDKEGFKKPNIDRLIGGKNQIGIFFTDKENASNFSKDLQVDLAEQAANRFEDTLSAEYKEQLRNTSKPILIPAIINASNPINLTRHDLQKQWEDLPNKVNSVLITDLAGKYGYEKVVFEPEQIHILGSKQDIEGFKNYVNSSASETTSATEEGVITTQPVEALKKPKNKLGIKLKGNRNKPKIDNDFGGFANSNLSLDEQAELLMKKCSK